jgi:hypothetical protein
VSGAVKITAARYGEQDVCAANAGLRIEPAERMKGGRAGNSERAASSIIFQAVCSLRSIRSIRIPKLSTPSIARPSIATTTAARAGTNKCEYGLNELNGHKRKKPFR